jgi:hypothetical protein
MSLFDLLGAAGAGYAQGAVKGEQAKINYKQQLQENDFKQQTIDLQKRKLLEDAHRATLDTRDRLKELGVKAATEALHTYSDPQFRADHDAQAKVAGLENSTQVSARLVKWLQAAMSGKDPGEFPYPKAIQKAAEIEGAQSAQPQEQNQYPPNAQTMTNVPGMEQYLEKSSPLMGAALGGLRAKTPNLYSPEDLNNTPQLKALLDMEANGQPGGVGFETMPPKSEAPHIIPSTAPPPGFVPQPPKTAAEIGYKKDAAAKQRTGADYDVARTETERIKQLNQKKADEALIHQREASANNLNAGAAATPARVAISSGTAAETARHNQQAEKNQRDQLNRQKAVDGVEATYKAALTKKTLADRQKIKDSLGRLGKTVKFTPDEQAEFQYLKENATSKSKITGKVQNTPGYNDRMESFLSKMKTKYGKQVAEPSTTPAASPTKANLPAKLSDFFQDDVAEVKKNLRNFDGWVNSLSPEAQETAKAIRAMMR